MSDKLLHKILDETLEIKKDVACIQTEIKHINSKISSHEKIHIKHEKLIDSNKVNHKPFLETLTSYCKDITIISGVMYAVYQFLIVK